MFFTDQAVANDERLLLTVLSTLSEEEETLSGVVSSKITNERTGRGIDRKSSITFNKYNDNGQIKPSDSLRFTARQVSLTYF